MGNSWTSNGRRSGQQNIESLRANEKVVVTLGELQTPLLLCFTPGIPRLAGVLCQGISRESHQLLRWDAVRGWKLEPADALANAESVLIPLPAPSFPGLHNWLAGIALEKTSPVLSRLAQRLPEPVRAGVGPEWLLLAAVWMLGIEWLDEEGPSSSRAVLDFLTRLDAPDSSRDCDGELLRRMGQAPFQRLPKAWAFRRLSDAQAPRLYLKRCGSAELQSVPELIRAEVGDAAARGESPAFDASDVEAIAVEVKWAVRGDAFSDMPKTALGVPISSSEYWVVIDVSSGRPMGCIGILTYGGYEGECWIGYLSYPGGGWILLDVANRRARERGFEKLWVWTTPENERARNFYRRTFDSELDRPGNSKDVRDAVCFVRSTGVV